MKISDIRRLSETFRDADPEDPAVQRQVRELLRSMGFDPGNMYQELEMESPYVDAHRDVTHSGAPVALHSHGFYELIFCRTNCGAEYLLGTERYRLQRGDIVMAAPGVSHRPILPKDMSEPYKRYVIWISREFMEQFFRISGRAARSWVSGGGILRTAGNRWEVLREYFQSAVLEAEQRRPGWEAALAGCVLTLLSQLERAAGDGTGAVLRAEEPELVDGIIAYVEDHLGEKLLIADVAERFYVSESSVSHLFRSKLDISFYGLVTQRRLIAAKDLIVRGRGMEQVAAAVGYRDYSSFYRAFKKEYGISPRQFKAMCDSEGQV